MNKKQLYQRISKDLNSIFNEQIIFSCCATIKSIVADH